MPFTGAAVRDVLGYLEARSVEDRFGYIVTPNVDHVVRNWRDGGELVQVYEDADLSLCDSRIVSLIGRLCGVRLPVVTGSDLTEILLEYLVDPYERVTIIGGTEALVGRLAKRFGLRNIRHHNPPMGFVRDPLAVLEASQFVEHNPARFVFLAVGSPQQEILAQSIKRRGQAVGIGLCIGASLLFLTGEVKRAPVWMQRARLEWLYRLAQEPRRMWRRYLYEGPKILRIAADHMAHQRTATPPRPAVSIIIPTFRREELLPRLIDRCSAQEGLNPASVEIIVVDSTPEASARGVVERSVGKGRARVRYLHDPRPGAAHARNLGIAASEGELVTFVADTELPAATWLEGMLMAQRVYGADMVLGPVEPAVRGGATALRRQLSRLLLAAERRRYRRCHRSAQALRGATRPVRRAALVPERAAASLELLSRPATAPTKTGPAGAEDALFLRHLQRDGKRIIWCHEAMVQERVPPACLTAAALLRLEFRRGQIGAGACLRDEPPAYGELAGWLLSGVARLGAGLLKGLIWPVNRQRGLQGLAMAANGLGRLFCFVPQQVGRATASVIHRSRRFDRRARDRLGRTTTYGEGSG